MKQCKHLWVMVVNFQQWSEHRVCLRCDKRTVIKREK